MMRESENLQTITKPGREIYRETYVQPLIQKNGVRLNIQRGDDEEVVLKPIIEAPRLDHKVSQKVIDIEGKEIITQPIVQEYYMQNDIKHIQNPVF